MNNSKNIISKEDLYNLTQQCTTIKEMASILSVSRHTCKKLLTKYNIEFETHSYKRNLNHPEIDKQWFIDNWLNTDKSLHTLSEEFKLSEAMLEYRSSSFGLTKSRKYIINESKILDAHNPNVAYLAGLIITDGYVNTNADFISLCLVGDSEFQLLKKIKDVFEINSPIQDYKLQDKKKHCLRISCSGIKEFFLNKFNIVATHKTFEADVPLDFYNEDCAKAYILGCADGDGCISHLNTNSPSFALLSASPIFIQGLGDILTKYTDIKYSIRQEKKYYVLHIGGLENLAHFLEWMYSTSCELCLGRKYEKFLMVKDIVCSARNSKELQK